MSNHLFAHGSVKNYYRYFLQTLLHYIDLNLAHVQMNKQYIYRSSESLERLFKSTDAALNDIDWSLFSTSKYYSFKKRLRLQVSLSQSLKHFMLYLLYSFAIYGNAYFHFYPCINRLFLDSKGIACYKVSSKKTSQN